LKKYRYEYNTQKTSIHSVFENSLFLDIETTGFGRASTFLTIIGLAWIEKDKVVMEQWLNETGQQEEPLLIMELERFLKNKTELPHLIHYNGTTFDLPYLKAKYDQYHLPSSLVQCDSIDLYHLAKKYKSFLSLEGLKQKKLEECFGLFREDKLSGQELIETYLLAIRQQDTHLLDAYLLHNKEDMEGMVFLLHLMKLDRIFHGDFEITEWAEAEDGLFITIGLSGDFFLSRPIAVSIGQIHFTFEQDSIWIKIPICPMEARFFYENYKDYYYLPLEDCAMHKSVASYVEKEYRRKATKETCYIKKTGSFLPLPLPDSLKLRKAVIKDCSNLPLFYQCYGDCTAYVLKDISKEDEKKLYLTQLLHSIL